uniref:non-specific serine/threonine protein kinase n=1 Tax=Florenciella sp. virus SA2 TaxID=3240092 RepID=A0AB39JBH3_9VIRU
MTSKIIIQDKYELISIINNGGFSKIYKGKHIYKDKYVAIKFDFNEISKHLIYNEIDIYLDLLKHRGNFFINIKTFGKIENKNYIIMDYIPDTIEHYVDKNIDKLDSKNVLKELINIIKHFHYYGYVHRDIKPDNVLVKNNKLYLIDFGLATKRNRQKYNNFIGNRLFSSYQVYLDEYEYRKRDDIISCYYIIFYLFSNKLLPWKSLYINDKSKEKLIYYNIKKNSNFELFYKDKNLTDIIKEYNNMHI